MSSREGVSRLYVGNLPPNLAESDLHNAFERYGRISKVTIKRGMSAGSQPFAFIEYEDPRDAEDALKEKDGAEMDGCRLRVEIPFNCRPGGSQGSRMTKGRGVAPRRGKCILEISGLPPTGSWQDLKDHFRAVGECMHADVFHDGTGEVSFATRREMDMAIDRMDGASFRSHEGEKSRLTLREKIERRDRHSDRSPDYGRGRDRRGRDRDSDRYRDDDDRDRRRDRGRDCSPYESYRSRRKDYSPGPSRRRRGSDDYGRDRRDKDSHSGGSDGGRGRSPEGSRRSRRRDSGTPSDGHRARGSPSPRKGSNCRDSDMREPHTDDNRDRRHSDDRNDTSRRPEETRSENGDEQLPAN